MIIHTLLIGYMIVELAHQMQLDYIELVKARNQVASSDANAIMQPTLPKAEPQTVDDCGNFSITSATEINNNDSVTYEWDVTYQKE